MISKGNNIQFLKRIYETMKINFISPELFSASQSWDRYSRLKLNGKGLQRL